MGVDADKASKAGLARQGGREVILCLAGKKWICSRQILILQPAAGDFSSWVGSGGAASTAKDLIGVSHWNVGIWYGRLLYCVSVLVRRQGLGFPGLYYIYPGDITGYEADLYWQIYLCIPVYSVGTYVQLSSPRDWMRAWYIWRSPVCRSKLESIKL